MHPTRPDSGALPAELLVHLIHRLRTAPGGEELIQRDLARLVAQVAAASVAIEVGTEQTWSVDGDALNERLHERNVAGIRIAAGAPAAELLALARALADNEAPINSTAAVRIERLPDPRPFSRPGANTPAIGTVLAPRARPDDQLAHLIEGVLHELDLAIRGQQWHAALHDAQAALRMLPGLAEESRRSLTLALKRLIDRPVVEALIEQGFRVPEEQRRTAEVLRAGGLAAAEVIIDCLKVNRTVGPGGFLLEALGGMPETFPLITPLMKSDRIAELALGAELLGRLGVPEAIPVLIGQAQHPDERVRHAVIDALGRYRDRTVVEPLRQALGHLSAETRVHAVRALASRGSGAMAMPLFAAFEVEKDPTAWQQLLDVLARLESVEASMALARVALQRRGFLSFGSADVKRQLSIVRALAAAGTAAAKQALARIAAEGSGEVRQSAQDALHSD